MCVLCDPQVLGMLSTPLERLSPAERVQAIRVARDAAMVAAAPLVEQVLRGESGFAGEAEPYLQEVIERAREDGILKRGDAFRWETEVRSGQALLDPRVQAFLSGCAEWVADYESRAAEERVVLARFLEARPNTLRFASLGRGWELWFEHGEHAYAVIHRDERSRVMAIYVEGLLHSMEPAELLPYTDLPEAGVDLIRQVQGGSPEEADDMLAGIVDVDALTEELVRRRGVAALLAGPEGEAEEIPFGEYVVIRANEPRTAD